MPASTCYTRFCKPARALLLAAVTLLPCAPLFAHHSAALFYSMGEKITLKGEVTRFNFRNPHAIVDLLVKNDKGESER